MLIKEYHVLTDSIDSQTKRPAGNKLQFEMDESVVTVAKDKPLPAPLSEKQNIVEGKL